MLQRFLGYAFAAAVVGFTGVMLTKILPYMTFERAINFLGTKSDAVLDRTYFMVAFYVHITSSVLAILGGIFSFFSRVIARHEATEGVSQSAYFHW